jgi:Cu/Ag efflux protein CusF
MQRVVKLCGVVVALCSLVAVAGAQAPKSEDKPSQQEQPIEVDAIKMNATVTVEKVDLADREVTLKTDRGSSFKVVAPAEVPDLDKLKQGDKVNVQYYSTMTLALDRMAEKPGVATGKTVMRVPGPLPTGVATRRITATLEVMNVDKAKNLVTLRGPDNEVDTVHVTDPTLQAELPRLKKGDKVRADYTAAIAISMTRPTK